MRFGRSFSALRSAARAARKEFSGAVVEIALFGSAAKGKIAPSDVDVCVFFRGESVPAQVSGFLKRKSGLSDGLHVSFLSWEDIFLRPHALVSRAFLEGVSLLNGKPLSERALGLAPFSVYSYALDGKDQREKTGFSRILRGRGGRGGLVESCGGRFLSRGVFLVPSARSAEMDGFLAESAVRHEKLDALLGTK